MTEIREVPASEPGALSGFAATCTTCGMELRSSLRTALELDVAAHLEWHASRPDPELDEACDPHRVAEELELGDLGFESSGRFVITCACGRKLRARTRPGALAGWRAHRRGRVPAMQITHARAVFDRALAEKRTARLEHDGSEPRQICCRCLRSCEPVVTVEFLYAAPPQLGRRRFHYCSDDAEIGRREYEQHRTSPTFSEVHLIDREAEALDVEAADDRDAKHRAALEGSERQ